MWLYLTNKIYSNNILNDDLKIYKGAIFENIIADSLTKLGKKLYYIKSTCYIYKKYTKIIISTKLMIFFQK